MNKPPPSRELQTTALKLSAYQLRRTGWTYAQVSQQLNISVSTIQRYEKELDGQLGTLPSTQIAKDQLQSMVPQCVDVFQDALTGKDKRLATEIASKILNSSGAITDRKNVVLIDDTNATDDELISEAQRIIAGVGKE